MNIREERRGNIAVIVLSGRLTVDDRQGRLKETVSAAVASGATHVLLDLSAVNYIDSTRLGELIASHITVSRGGGRLRLVGTPARILELLTIAGLEGIFQTFPSLDEASKGLGVSTT